MTDQMSDRITLVLVRHFVFVAWQPICCFLRTTSFDGRIYFCYIVTLLIHDIDLLICVYYIKHCRVTLYEITILLKQYAP